MKTNVYSLVKKLSLGFLSVILLSCSESPADETGGVPADLQVVTNSAVIRADEAADSGDIVGVRDELIIGDAETMEVLYPQQAMSMAAYEHAILPGVTTKTFVKTTIRKARVMAADKEETLTGWPIDVHGAVVSMIESLKARLGNSQSIRIIVELWFDPVSESDFNRMYPDGASASTLISGEDL